MNNIKIDAILLNEYYLYLPAEGIDIKLVRNDYNLLTTNLADTRPLYVTESFELPLDGNMEVFNKLAGKSKECQLLYNDIPLIIGEMQEYSVDNKRRIIRVSVVSRFKEVVDFMGDNVLYLDVINLEKWNYIIKSDFNSNSSNDLLAFAYYNPMDTDTGQIVLNQSNINDYCKPSLRIINYFKKVFESVGWTANWDDLPDDAQNLCLLPAVPYRCCSFEFEQTDVEWTLEGNASLMFPLENDTCGFNNVSEGVSGALIGSGSTIKVQQPNRLQSFKIRAFYECPDPIKFTLEESGRPDSPLLSVVSLGDSILNQTTDSINTKEGLNNIGIRLTNLNNYPIKIKMKKWMFYNLFTVYETNQDNYISPAGYFFTVVDNLPVITPLNLYRELLTLFQIAQETNDTLRTVHFYSINDALNKEDSITLDQYTFWNGYEAIGEPDGLAKINIIRYKNDIKRQQYFKINIPQLPASNVYFESLFSHSETNNLWESLTLPALKYKVKQVNNVSVEYLEWSDIQPILGIFQTQYKPSGLLAYPMIFNTITMANITQKYWGNIIKFLSSKNLSNPNIYKLKMRLSYFDYVNIMKQSNLFYYDNYPAVLVEGTYSVLDHEFDGTFISLK